LLCFIWKTISFTSLSVNIAFSFSLSSAEICEIMTAFLFSSREKFPPV
jgi:hypothetical protein